MTKIKKQRIDILLVERGLIDSREQAKRMIMAGQVYTNEQRLDKPGEKIAEDQPLTIKGNTLRYVSRGGLKLEKAITHFHLDVTDRTLIDIGSSTGGFTDCALQHGATHSYAIDVGYNQLAWKLRQDPRVTVMERCNFRHMTRADLEGEMPNLASIDVSFISLSLILPVLSTMLQNKSDVVALIKPQFEAGREQVGKNGIVRDPKVHQAVVEKIVRLAESLKFQVKNISFSPITGGEGNIEFLIHLFWDEQEALQPFLMEEISNVVQDAHQTLKK